MNRNFLSRYVGPLLLMVVVQPLWTAMLHAAEKYPPGPGKVHPQIVLRTLEGDRTIALSSLRGKKVLLVHFASWSEECRKDVPVWYEKTKLFVAEGQLAVLGIAHEQHADRCRLFAQWKDIDWPILHDPLNLGEVETLPLIVAIDERGIVRDTGSDLGKILDRFLAQTFSAPPKPLRAETEQLQDPRLTRRLAREARSAQAWRDHGDALVMAGKPAQIDEALEAYQTGGQMNPKDAESFFRLGVTYRIRFDRPEHQPGDFQAAVDAWRKAAKLRPQNEVALARLQQYGPNLGKPCAFYDWIDQAAKDITSRGRTPVRLAVEPGVLERGVPSTKFFTKSSSKPKEEPISGAKADSDGLVRVEQTIVWGVGKKTERVAAVHLTLWPDAKRAVRWEPGEPLRLWMERPKSAVLSRRFVRYDPTSLSLPDGPRTLSLEVRLPSSGDGTSISSQAAYTIRTGQDGQAQTLQQSIEIKLPAK
jgi:hypothetical protein